MHWAVYIVSDAVQTSVWTETKKEKAIELADRENKGAWCHSVG